jgi:hypothetical protein
MTPEEIQLRDLQLARAGYLTGEPLARALGLMESKTGGQKGLRQISATSSAPESLPTGVVDPEYVRIDEFDGQASLVLKARRHAHGTAKEYFIVWEDRNVDPLKLNE